MERGSCSRAAQGRGGSSSCRLSIIDKGVLMASAPFDARWQRSRHTRATCTTTTVGSFSNKYWVCWPVPDGGLVRSPLSGGWEVIKGIMTRQWTRLIALGVGTRRPASCTTRPQADEVQSPRKLVDINRWLGSSGQKKADPVELTTMRPARESSNYSTLGASTRSSASMLPSYG